MLPDKLSSRLAQKLLVFDGAFGTVLKDWTESRQPCLDILNLKSRPHSAFVTRLHRLYCESGSDCILTNTYGANRVKLGRYGHTHLVEEVNREGVALAREVSDEYGVLLGGSVGPLEFRDRGLGRETLKAYYKEVYLEQIGALVEGVDFLLLETFQDLLELESALEVASSYEIEIAVSIGGITHGHTGAGARVEDMIAMAESSTNVVLLGANCRGPYDIFEGAQTLLATTKLPVLAMPNAGVPEFDRGQVVYGVEPEAFVASAQKLVKAGVRAIGGCCGTTPEHIQLLSKEFPERVMLPVDLDILAFKKSKAIEFRASSLKDEEKHQVQEILSQPFVTSVEIRPSRKISLDALCQTASDWASLGVDLFDVPDNAGARVALDPMVAAAMIQLASRKPCLMHMSATSRNLIATQSYLLGAWELGIQGVLAVSGDHPNVGDHDKYASRVCDVKSSVELLHLISGLNEGRLFNQGGCQKTNFLTGCGFNPHRNPKPQLKWLQRKLDAGARYIYTQPVFTIEQAERAMEILSPYDIPVLLGVLPLSTKRNARFFAAGKIPGIEVPTELLEQYEKTSSDSEAEELGLTRACELLAYLAKNARGIYLIPPFSKRQEQLMEVMLTLILEQRENEVVGELV